MKGVTCKKLVAKDGKTFRTSPFRVTCCTESADLFYDETLWPSGVKLRDWSFILRGIMAAHSSNFVTYNLHGLNNGRSGLFDLCSNPKTVLVAVQEHWLTPNNLNDLNSIHPDFVGFGISAMSDRLCSGIYHGWPFGGVWVEKNCFTPVSHWLQG